MGSSLIAGEKSGLRQQNNTLHSTADKRLDSVDSSNEPTEIQRFYSGASVLVTGATGFMGKVLIEKLLRSCPDIESIYMMVREKKGRSLDERIDDLVSSPCFDRIKREQPDFRSKLHAVAGDIGLEGLGISDSDRHFLKQQITIVFHVAATVRFDEHLKLAILQNVRGTREVLNLCRTFSNIKSFVHVSTAYSNCPTKQIDERFYKAHLPSDQAIYLAETSDITTLDRLSHKLMGYWPNTYSFTKALSEDVVRNHSHGFPVAVFRPSIVVSTRSEPMAGWIDNVYGPTGVVVAVSAGLLRTMQVTSQTEANIVPCDMVINAIITSAWDVAVNRTIPDVPIYNYVALGSNPLSWKRYMDLFVEHGKKAPPSRMIWKPTNTLISNRHLYLFVRLLVHILPAMLVDIFLLATNKSPMMVKVYRKIHKFTNVIAYFATQQWDFESRNVEGMWKRLHHKDRELFFFDMSTLDWSIFIQDSWPGMRQYLLKDPMDTLQAAFVTYRRLLTLHRLLVFVLGVTTTWILPLIWARVTLGAYGKLDLVDPIGSDRIIAFGNLQD